MAIRELNKISPRALMQRITDELEGLIITDSEGRYIYVNHRWSSLTGYTLDQVKGRYVRDIVVNSLVDEVLKSQKFISGNAVLLNVRTGAEVPVYCSYTPLFHEGEIEGCFVYMIPKSEHTSMAIPPNVATLLEELNKQLLLVQPRSVVAASPLDSIIGDSPEIMRMKNEIICAARSSSTVLIEGETGSGKELVAHAIHELSPRQNHRLVKVNCAAIPSELLESEFFGYEEGAFTGARRGGQAGKFEIANNGSLFLDEINQMPFSLQPKLLRTLQEREIERIGSSATIPVDTRIISATNVPLDQLVQEGTFRSDLYYRLNVIRIRIPPLRERRSDIPLLIDHLLKHLNFQLNLQIPGITPETVARLMEYDWPGNVRELQNVLERAMNLAWFETLEWKYFSDYFSHPAYSIPFSFGASPPREPEKPPTLRQRAGAAEREILIETIKNCQGNKAAAARELGISRTILYRKLHKYKLI